MSDFTVISDGRVDADSPIDEDLITDLRENDEYLFERAVRAGTHATGVRLAIARGADDFSDATADGTVSFSGTITFSTADSDDGDPNFDVAPRVILTIERNGGDAWTANITAMRIPLHITDGSLSTTGFTWGFECTVAGPNNIVGKVHWIAIGTVTTGE
jgi:hypothetical protein